MADELKLEGETGDGDLGRDLNALRVSAQMCDVVLVSGQHRANAHRLVLAAKSPYFLAMFGGGFSEKEMAEVTLKDSVDGEILETLVEYLYLGVITINEMNAQLLLAAADLLLMLKLKAGCWQFLKSHVHADNSVRMWALAVQYSDNELLKKARECTLKNFEKVADGEAFLELDLPQLVDLLNDNRLVVQNEEVAYRAAMRWVRHRQDDRKTHLLDILKSVRLLLCNGQFLVETVLAEELIKDSDECRRLVDDAIHQLLVFFAAKQPKNSRLLEDLRRTPSLQTLYAIGGSGTNSAEKYCPLTNTFSPVTAMPLPRYAFGCAVINDRIMVIGGMSDAKSSSVECYEPVSDQWSSLAPLAAPRAYCSAAVLTGRVYAVGGQGTSGSAPLASMESYDPISDSWSPQPPMPTGRWQCRTAVLGDRLYVLGGAASDYPGAQWAATTEVTAVVEIFDPQTGAWSTAPPMMSARRSFGCAVFSGRIFVAGGTGSNSGVRLSSVESFSSTDQQWHGCGDLSGTAREELSLAVVDGRLLAIGGYTGTRAVKTVEEYVPETNTWRHLCDMAHGRYFHGVAVLSML